MRSITCCIEEKYPTHQLGRYEITSLLPQQLKQEVNKTHIQFMGHPASVSGLRYQRVGRHQWVVERTLSCLNRYRRLKGRYERRADVHQAFLKLGCAL